jgi:UDP-N-acetylglucosamine acyltransferase
MSPPKIHQSAIVDPAAELDGSVAVGAYAVIGAGVRIGAGTTVGPHAVIEGPTTIGRDNRIFQFASLGAAPQDKKYAGEPTGLEIGDRNTIREFVTINRGTVQDRGLTTLGHDNWIMAYVHVAHDCVIGSHTIFANTTNLAGHVRIGDWVILGGCTQVHQFCQIGAHAMTGVSSVVLHDIPPFVMASGSSARAHGLNAEGLRRRGFDAARIATLRRAYKTLYKSGLTLQQAIAALRDEASAARRAEAEDKGEGTVEGRGTGVSQAGSADDLDLLLAFLGGVTRGIVR